MTDQIRTVLAAVPSYAYFLGGLVAVLTGGLLELHGMLQAAGMGS